jgi:hypothetical protein
MVLCCEDRHDAHSEPFHHHHVAVEMRHFTIAKQMIPTAAPNAWKSVCQEGASGRPITTVLHNPSVFALRTWETDRTTPVLFILNSTLLI